MAGWILYAGGSGVYHRPVTERIIASIVGSDGEGTRLIDFLCKRFTYCRQLQWLAFIDEGRLLVDGQSAGKDQQLASGQRIEFRPPAESEPAVNTDYSILHENSRLLVLYKPPLLPIHPSGRYFAHTLWYLLNRDVGTIHIATRLDRETSGLVLAAKDAGAARYLQEQQGLGTIRKTYLALVHGNFPASRIDASGWLVPDLQSEVRKKRRFVPCTDSGTAVPPASACLEQDNPFLESGSTPGMKPGAESCRTLLTGHGSWTAEDGERSLVEARLLTGRTHQIRASLHSMGYPVLGDKLYGLDEAFFLRFIENNLTPTDLSQLVLPYQALHCSSLDFQDIDGTRLSISVPAPWRKLVPPDRSASAS